MTDFENQRVWQVVSGAGGVVVKEIRPDDSKRICGDSIRPQPRETPVDVSVTTEDGVATVVTNSAPVAIAPALAASVVASEAVAVPAAAEALAISASSNTPTVDILINYDTDAAS